ncbi:hypothetical protein [Leptospira santarosai]|uniref:hypothetical protein n=1 Tax=Leptospira santarosai TaxID=28183 RepID=UPI00037996E1
MNSSPKKEKCLHSSSVESIPKDESGVPKCSSRRLSKEIREKIKTELRYRFGSVAEWARTNDLNYGYVTQVLNGIAPGHNIRALLEKDGLA